MNKHLSRKPTDISTSSWWYEEPRGINIVVERNPATTQHIIPWKQIERALLRKKGTVDYTAPTKWDAK